MEAFCAQTNYSVFGLIHRRFCSINTKTIASEQNDFNLVKCIYMNTCRWNFFSHRKFLAMKKNVSADLK